VTTRTQQQPPSGLHGDTALESEAAAVVAVARASVAPIEVTVTDDDDHGLELRLYGVDGSGGHRLVETVDLEKVRDAPRSKRGEVKVATPAALVTYAERHTDEECSTLWAELDAGRLTVIINDHGSDLDGTAEPGWADHRVQMQLQRPLPWQAWTALNGKALSQVELAEFLEEHLLDVVDPDGSTLLEVTQTFHATAGATFKSAVALSSGEQRLVYEEDVQASAGRNQQTEIPTDLTLRLAPWLGVDPVEVRAKFRFRVRDGHLSLSVRLLNLEEVSRAAVTDAMQLVAGQLALPAIEGTPPPARR
jgi:uncharacterized protein YfdQ (DUF2303 family)